MDNTVDPAGKASIPVVEDTPDNLDLISCRLKDSERFMVARQARP